VDKPTVAGGEPISYRAGLKLQWKGPEACPKDNGVPQAVTGLYIP
jgi:hypothetical protein